MFPGGTNKQYDVGGSGGNDDVDVDEEIDYGPEILVPYNPLIPHGIVRFFVYPVSYITNLVCYCQAQPSSIQLQLSWLG